MKIVIIGGVAGGASTATRLRRLNEKAEIVIYERSGFISYANCGLPYYVGGVINDASLLTLQTPQSFFKRFNIVAKVNHEVTDVDVQNKTLNVTNLATGQTFVDTYDKLVLATGAKPIVPPFYVQHEGVFTLRTVEDTLKISQHVHQKHPKSAIVVGGGFVGLEMAENLRNLGMSVSVVQLSNHLLPILDCDMASFVHAKLRSKGVEILLGKNTQSMRFDGEKIVLDFQDGQHACADMVVVAIGVQPDTALAERAGLELGAKGAIKVDSHMQTSSPDVFAVGDAVQIRHFVTQQDALVSLAGPANKQARVVANNVCGFPTEYQGAQGTSVIKLFDMAVATTGLNEFQAKSSGYQCQSVVLTQNSHADYYPNASAMTLKLVFDQQTYKILGAQIVGYDGVDKRIDVIATAMRAGLKAHQLMDLDLAYAPPFSSAKDPVNMLGFVVDNIKKGVVKQFYVQDLPSLCHRQDVVLLDTRTEQEYKWGHVEGFVNIPLDELRQSINKLDKNKKVYVMCQSGVRSYLATRILAQHGFDAYNFSGGYRLYSSIVTEQVASAHCYSCGMDKCFKL